MLINSVVEYLGLSTRLITVMLLLVELTIVLSLDKVDSLNVQVFTHTVVTMFSSYGLPNAIECVC